MAAYTISMVQVIDPDRYTPYSQRAPGVFAKFGAKVRVRGGRVAALEGPAPPERNILVEFDDLDRVKAWFESPDYREILKMREGAAEVSLSALEGDPLRLGDGERPGYFVSKVNVHKPDAYAAYVERAVPLVEAAGGIFAARGDLVCLEGDEPYERGLIITFPSFAAACDFYHSPAYQEIIPMREGAAEVQFYVLEGM